MRKLKLEDKHFITQIAYIHERELAQQDNRDHPTNFAVSLREEMIIRRLKYMNDVIYISIVDDYLAGFIWGHFQQEERVVVIEIVYVAPDYRNQHLASAMKNVIEQWAIAKGAKQISGTVNHSNRAMIELNNKLGYATEKLIMTKDLASIDEQQNE